MSFLSRKPARPGGRGGDADREDGYDDYDDDLYAPDGYQSEDESWSPGEYFSPEGIKGRWAGEHPAGRAGGHGQREDQAGEAGYQDGGPGFTSGAYELPDGADEDRPERGRRRRREERADWTGSLRLRLRRDRGEDIWPDDGISDEDYWASVASDRPLTDAGQDAGEDQPDSRRGRRARTAAADGGSRSGASQAGAGQPGRGQRGSGERPAGQHEGGQRGVTGRLGPPPGLAADFTADRGTGSLPTVGVTVSRPPASPGDGRIGTAGARGSGPQAASRGSGPLGVARGSGPQAVSRTSGPQPGWTGPGQRDQGQRDQGQRDQGQRDQGQRGQGSASGGFPAPARPSFQPGYQPPADSRPASRPADRGDWGERTERIERVGPSGYPDSYREQPAAAAGPSPASSWPPLPSAAASATGASQGRPQAADRPVPGRDDNTRWRPPEWREGGRDTDREAASIWSAPARDTGRRQASDDPLTSNAYSRSSRTDTDGRSYRLAARLSQAQPKLTDATEVFAAGSYEDARSGSYPASPGQPSASHASAEPSFVPAEQRSGAHRQYPGSAAAAPTGSGRPSGAASGPHPWPGPGVRTSGPQAQGPGPASLGQPTGGQPALGQSALGRPSASQPGYGQPAHNGGGYDRTGYRQPGYDRPVSSPPGRQPGGTGPVAPPPGYGQADARRPGAPGGPASPPSPAYPPGSPLSAPVPAGTAVPAGTPAPSNTAAPANGTVPPSGTAPSSAAVPPGTPGGRNPYDAGTGAHPYPGARPYPDRPAAQDTDGGPYRRPGVPGVPGVPGTGGYPAGSAGPAQPDPEQPDYGNSYGNGHQPRGERPY